MEEKSLEEHLLDQFNNFIEDAVEYLIPVSKESGIIEMDKKYACLNLTVDGPVNGEKVAEILSSYNLSFDRKLVCETKFIDVYVHKDAKIDDFIEVLHMYKLKHDDKYTYIIL